VDRHGERPVSSTGFAPGQTLGVGGMCQKEVQKKEKKDIAPYAPYREAAAGSQLGEEDRWISLDRLLPHHLSRNVGDDVKPAHTRVRESTHEISSRNL